jgi:hypothetical protein
LRRNLILVVLVNFKSIQILGFISGMEQSGVLAGPITRRSCGSNPTPAIWDLNVVYFGFVEDEIGRANVRPKSHSRYSLFCNYYKVVIYHKIYKPLSIYQNMKEENDLENSINRCENPIYRIAKGLREEGYEIAGHMGIKVPKEKQPPHNMVGILRKKEPIKKRFLGIIPYTEKQRHDYVGKLWTDNVEKGAIEDKKWILNIYGQDNFTEVTGLMNKFASPDVEIDRFVYKDKREESYLFDEVA